MKHIIVFLICLLSVALAAEAPNVVTCGSAFKLIHRLSNYHVLSSQASWGSGSRLQAVTACTPESTNPMAMWQITFGFNSGSGACGSGDSIKCGDVVALKHLATKKYLRSNKERAPLSGRQEVSGDNGTFSTADNWILQCNSGNILTKDTVFKLKHVETGMYLFTRLNDRFTHQNCRGCPIVNQLEMSASGLGDTNAEFKIGDGFFVASEEERLVRDYTDFSAPKEGKNNNVKDEL